jgi:hypothetical protein
MWDVRRNINIERLPQRRIVVRFSFRGAPKGKRSWWLVLDRPEPDLCLTDPGFGVDLTVHADAVTMAEVWVGDLDLVGAIRCRRIFLEGPSHLRRAFPSWLRLSPLTKVSRPLKRSGPPARRTVAGSLVDRSNEETDHEDEHAALDEKEVLSNVVDRLPITRRPSPHLLLPALRSRTSLQL